MGVMVSRGSAATVTFSTPQEIIISHSDDSIKIGDGTTLADVTIAQALKTDSSHVTQPVSGTVSVQGDVGTLDQLDLTNSNPAVVAIVDANGDQITSFGGGTQYTEGDTDASITGGALLMEGAANTLVPVQGTVADGVLVNLGSNNDVTVTGTVTANAGSGTFAVSGTVAATQSGTWTVGNASGASAVNIQDGGNIITVDGTVNAAQSGTWNVTNISGTVSLPTGAATETTLSTLNGKVPSNLTVSSTRLLVDGSGVTQPVSGTVTANPTFPSSSSVTSVAASASSVQLLALNSARRGAMVYNDSSAILYLKLGTTASTSSFTVAMAASSYYELPQPCYTGRIDGIWASATGNARITEIS